MSDEIETTSDDASGTGDALAAFVDEEPEKPEQSAADDGDETEEGLRRAEPEKPKARKEAPKEDREAKPKEEKPKDEPPPKPKTYKHKVMGEEREIDAERLDALAQELGVDSRELLSASSLKRASYEKMKEAAEARKQVEEARALAKKDPASALKLLGLDPEEYAKAAERLVFERYQREFGPDGQPLTAEQREIAALRADAAKREQEKQAEADKARQAEESQARQAAEQHAVKAIVSHLEKSGDPKFLMSRVAGHLSDLIEQTGNPDFADHLADASALAWEDIQEEHAKLYEGMPFQGLKAKFPGLVEKVRKGLVEEWRSRGKQKEPDRQPEERAPQRRARRTTSDVMSDFIDGR